MGFYNGLQTRKHDFWRRHDFLTYGQDRNEGFWGQKMTILQRITTGKRDFLQYHEFLASDHDFMGVPAVVFNWISIGKPSQTT